MKRSSVIEELSVANFIASLVYPEASSLYARAEFIKSGWAIQRCSLINASWINEIRQELWLMRSMRGPVCFYCEELDLDIIIEDKFAIALLPPRHVSVVVCVLI